MMSLVNNMKIKIEFFIGEKHYLIRLYSVIIVLALFFIPNVILANTYYISPVGNDSASGTTEITPISTIKHAYKLMSPGDTLVFLDGTYTQQLYPPVSLSGSDGAYTVFKAKNPGKVTLAPVSYSTYEAALYVYSNVSGGTSHHFQFIGFHVIGNGEAFAIRLNSGDNIAENLITHDIIIQRCGARGSAKDTNTNAFEVSNVKDTLIEDVYAYGFGRKALEVFGARNITVRRAVVRYDWWEGDSYKSNDPRPNFTAYNTINSTFENIISFDAGPHPIGRNPDRSAIVASGNDTAVSSISGSSNNGYYGCVVINNNPAAGIHNGISVNGGTGSPATAISFKDIVVWGQKSYGVNIHDNIIGCTLTNLTVGSSGLTGIRVNPNPAYTISNITAINSVVKDSGASGFYNISTTNCSATGNSNSNLEASFMPTITHIPTNTPVLNHPRGADVTKKYVDGVKTSDPLWPWPYEDIIKDNMCSDDDLQEISSAINAKDGTNINYEPGLCASRKSLTDYVWSYLGNTVPPFPEIYRDAATEKRILSWDVNKDIANVTGYKIYYYPNNVKTLVATVQGLNNSTYDITSYNDSNGQCIEEFAVTAVKNGGEETGISYKVSCAPMR